MALLVLNHTKPRILSSILYHIVELPEYKTSVPKEDSKVEKSSKSTGAPATQSNHIKNVATTTSNKQNVEKGPEGKRESNNNGNLKSEKDPKKTIRENVECKRKTVTKAEVNTALQLAKQKGIMNDVINLEETDDNSNWKEVIRKPNRKSVERKHKVIGEGCELEANLKAAERKAWVFVRRLSKETTEEMIKTHVEAIIKHNNISVEIKESKYNNKNFVVGIPLKDIDVINNPKNWPVGVSVEKYIFRWAPTKGTKT